MADTPEAANSSIPTADDVKAAEAVLAPKQSDQAEPQEQDGPAAEEMIFGKYKSLEDAQNAYTESQRKITELSEKIKKIQDSVTGESAGSDDDNIVKLAGLDEQELVKQFMDNGELTKDQYAALRGKRVGKDLADTYLKGLLAMAKLESHQRQAALDKTYEAVGGQENAQEILKWAGMAIEDGPRKEALNKLISDSEWGPRFMQFLDDQRQADGQVQKAPINRATPASPASIQSMPLNDRARLAERALNGDESALRAFTR